MLPKPLKHDVLRMSRIIMEDDVYDEMRLRNIEPFGEYFMGVNDSLSCMDFNSLYELMEGGIIDLG